MTEVSSPEKLGQVRRKLFKAAPKVVVAAGLSYLATHESELASRGEFVVGGVSYYPLYERHDVGPKSPFLPSTNGLFCEGLPSGTDGRIDGNFTLPPAKAIDYLTAASPVGKETIDKALDMGAVVAVGDAISFQALARAILTFPEKKADERRRDFLGAGALLVPFLERLQGKRVKSLSRRRFLKLGAVATAGLGLHLLAAGQRIRKLAETTYDDKDYASPLVQKAAERITARINGLVSHFNPEDYHIFSRNLLFALKTKMLAAYLKAEMVDRQPRVAFLVGANHAGTEDFLCLPAPVLRQMLIGIGGLDVYYSALETGGATNFATTRLIKRTAGEYMDLKLVDADLKKALVAAYPKLSDE